MAVSRAWYPSIWKKSDLVFMMLFQPVAGIVTTKANKRGMENFQGQSIGISVLVIICYFFESSVARKLPQLSYRASRIFALTLSSSCSLESPLCGCKFRCTNQHSTASNVCMMNTYCSQPSPHLLSGPYLWVAGRIGGGREHVRPPDGPGSSCCHDAREAWSRVISMLFVYFKV